MVTLPAPNVRQRVSPQPPGRAVTAVAWLMALWGVGFAAVNVGFEISGYFDDGEYAEYAAAFTVMNWLVVGLKLFSAAVALLSVAKRPPPLAPPVMGLLVWGVFATLAVYFLGGVAQMLGMAFGVMGSAAQIDPTSVAYLILFLAAATGWGVLAISYSKRNALGRAPAVFGILGAPIVLWLVLAAIPALLSAVGVMPAS
jgi:hypothetical protein